MIKILYIALFVSIITYSFWENIPIDYFFYYGNALFIFLLCFYIFFTDKKSVIKFVLFSLSLNNLFDEITNKADKLYFSEILTGVAIILFAFYKNYYNDRKRTELN